jgi:molybdopterin synthase catalytic subunit
VRSVLETLKKSFLLGLPPGTRVLYALNRSHVDEGAEVAAGDEVGLFPPVSGGSGADERLVLSSEPLDATALTNAVRSPSCGAVLTFEGTVRDHNEGSPVSSIDYDAYPEMALEVLSGIREEVEARHPGVRLALAHRTGLLQLGEASVVVACAAPHRREAFAACRLAMDRIKEAVPVWKHERTEDGEQRWL